MIIGIININIGNIFSLYSTISKIIERNDKCIIIKKKKNIKKCDKLIFPGQGNIKTIKTNLKNIEFLIEIKKAIINKQFLGICLGSQLSFCFNKEGNFNGLCYIKNKIKKFNCKYKKEFKVPFIGWNSIQLTKKKNSLTKNIKNKSLYYFSHSYYSPINKHTIAYSYNYIKFGCIYSYKNLNLTQFHPEKSGKCGNKLIENFIKKQ
ncbi:MAG: imidazole glycerol phosphate synthase subunit HisH [Candidatus Vidania fulgoroideorum]